MCWDKDIHSFTQAGLSQASLITVLPFYRLEIWDWIWELRETLWLTGRMVSVFNEIPTLFLTSYFTILLVYII